MKGLVIKNTGSWYLVKTEDGRTIECKIKGNFRLKGIRSTNPIAVGDYVQIIINNEGTAFISEIEDRKNYIIRRASNLSKQSHILAANLDQCMLIVTINYPETSTIFIDRFLATAEAYRVPVSMFAREVVICGCMTQIGLKHANQFNQFNLASDIMEPFRPIIDRIVYQNRHNNFVKIKKELFSIFSETYPYNGKEMYLSNIVSDYTKKVIKALNQLDEEIPEFRI